MEAGNLPVQYAVVVTEVSKHEIESWITTDVIDENYVDEDTGREGRLIGVYIGQARVHTAFTTNYHEHEDRLDAVTEFGEKLYFLLQKG